MHELACSAGVLSNLFARNCFDLVAGNILENVEVRLYVKVSIREAVNAASILYRFTGRPVST